ncbi:unnamed protein product (macronuclear) [Paramecium tetraurelia]|uniref:Serine/threonine-protein kinase PLK n=1 Tax=Paramecium tetraurelia TaxID=5888 RepID=A0BHH1_PARTE|nr:uncharacterized protein GSPATT00029023001 [Paramecium tetraurelia]CAK57988.1 unnamed protein product [Paramecium tetraurelia]|eukprot:XP_001425386.1 hypothetical protein (macronuclear) [Paramecium tetraurelia strain d4-2]
MEEQQQIENTIIEERYKKADGETAYRRYQKGKVLGKGGFAKCYEVTSIESKKVLAAKIIAKSTLKKGRTKAKLITEIKLHKSLHHQNIVQFEDVFEDNDNVYILLELCQNQTLNELLKRRRRITQIEVQCYLKQLIGALKYIHSHRVLHRDLKLGNLFINDKMELKLGDFGLATKLDYDGQRRHTICGTPNYIAPEILDERLGHSYQADIWSVGVIIYTLLIGKPPFETSDVKTTYNKISQCQFNFPDHIQISENARNLISRILILDPSKRLTLDEILAHPFMTSNPIPKTTHISQLLSPPTAAWLSQYSQASMLNSKQLQPELVSVKSTSQIPKMNNLFSTQLKMSQAERIKTLTEGINYLSEKQQTKTQQEQILENNEQQELSKENDVVYVIKCCDYQSKYGIGYVLSNHHSGVLFNDSTKIIQCNRLEFNYFDSCNQKSSHEFENYPQELNKKVTLLQKFTQYLGVDENNTVSNSQISTIFVDKFLKTRNALLLKLSNGVIQADFIDKTVIVISPNENILFVNEKGDKFSYNLEQIKDKDKIQRRYNYVQQLRGDCQ